MRPIIGWLISGLALALAYFLQRLVWPLIPASPFLLFYPVIFLSAWVGGRICGGLSTLIATGIVEYAFLPPYGGFDFRQNWLSELIFVAIGFAITALINRQKDTHEIAVYAGSRLRNLVDWLDHAIVFEMDGETFDCSFVSKGSERLLQVPMGEWYERPGKFIELVHPEDRAQVLEILTRTMSGQNDQSVDHRLVAADGKSRWYHTGIHADREEGRTKIRAISVEIERLKKTEERERSLKEQSEAQKKMYDALLDATDDHVFMMDREERFLYANRAFLESIRSNLKSHGKDLEESILGRKSREIENDPAFMEHFESNVKRALRGETVQQETNYHTPAGLQTFEYILTPIYGDTGEVEAITGFSRNVHLRKAAEQALRQSQERLQLALDAAKSGTFEWDLDSDRHIWDARTEELFGFAPGTFPQTRKAFESRLHPDDIDRVLSVAEKAFKEHRDLINEYRVLLPNGNVRWVLANGKAFYDPSGRPIRILGVIQDVTERKKIEAKLAETADRVDLALKAGKIGIFEMDLRHPEVPVNWSTRQYEIFGMDPSKEALNYQMFRKRIHPDDLAAVDREFEASVREKRDFNQTYRIILEDGRTRWVQARALTFYDEEGKLSRMIGTNIDVTETIQAQEAVRESAVRFRELAESMPQIVWATDPSGKAYYYNSQWFEYLGIPRTEAASFDRWKYIHPDDKEKANQSWSEASRSRSMFQVELRLRGHDGEYHWFLSRALPVFNSQGELVRWYGTLTNIDEHKRVEEVTSHALKAREEMLAVVSHDLRNPLGSILMSAAMIKRKLSSEDAFTIAQAGKIQRAGERMNQMIEDLLNLAKIEAGTFSLSKREICGCDVVTEAVEMMSAQAHEKNIKVETSGIDQPLQMSCDHNQVLRVFSNLIGNAIKFTPEDGLVRVSAQDQGDNVLFTVSDTGPGIAEHHIPHVFDRYWQASKTQHMGTGLGLSISKGIVEAHGGKIWVTSRFGHGSTFSFTLPKASANSLNPNAQVRRNA